ncbi:MAG TPA: hypothetical protein VF691_13990, partial [Cytophagaceae bacterium]
ILRYYEVKRRVEQRLKTEAEAVFRAKEDSGLNWSEKAGFGRHLRFIKFKEIKLTDRINTTYPKIYCRL